MKTTKTLAGLAGLFLVASAPAMSAEAPKVEEVLATFTDTFVVPTYVSLSDAAIQFADAAKALQAKNTNTNIAAAVKAWSGARTHWEQSEACLFGPAEFANLDPKLDSWPLDQQQLDAILKVVKSGAIEVDASYVRDYLGAALRGFHAAEYLLFRDGKARNANSMTKAERDYLAAVAEVIAEDCIQLEAAWNGADSLSEAKAKILEDAEIEKDGQYATELKNAGKGGSRYDSTDDAIEEIMVGCVDIIVELAGAKIGEPFEAQDAKLFESWYSHTSRTDSRDNLTSVKMAYEGVNAGGKSLSALVASKDAAADQAVRDSFAEVLANMDAFTKPFAKSLGEKEAFTKLVASLTKLAENLEATQEVLLGTGEEK